MPSSRIAILDSGVNPNHPHIGNIVGGIEVRPEGLFDNTIDLLGHGTAVTAAIQEKAPAADVFVVRIFHRELSSTILQLTAGIQWALDQRVDFINLSLGTTTASHRERLEPLIERAAIQGCRIISARHIGGVPAYPGCMATVLGVESDVLVAREKVLFRDDVAIASPYPRPIPGLPPERNLSGISFAVANVTGYLAACVMAETARSQSVGSQP
jgi:hypothetical protein